MAKYEGLFGGGSASGGSLFGSGGDVKSYRKKGKKRKKPWYERALDKTAETAGGILGGLIYTGVGVTKDVGRVGLDALETFTPLDNKDYDYQTDDIAKAIIDDYKKRYTRDGNLSWDAWVDAWKNDPFANILDVASVAAAAFTFGGSLAARGAATATNGGRAAVAANAARAAGNLGKAEKLAYRSRVNARARFSGLDVDEELTQLRRDWDEAAKLHGADSPEATKAQTLYEGAITNVDAKAKQYGAQQSFTQRKMTGGRNSSRVRELEDGTVLAPRRIYLRDNTEGAGIIVDSIPLAPGMHRRGMQKAGASISNALPNAKLIGANSRAGNQANRLNRVMNENEGAAVFAPAASWLTGGAWAFRHMTPEEETATYLRSVLGEANVDRLAKAATPEERAAIELEMRSKVEAYRNFLGARGRSLTGLSKEQFDEAMNNKGLSGIVLDDAHLERMKAAASVDDELMDLAVKEARRLGIDVDAALAAGQPDSILQPLVDSGWLARVAANRRNLILHGETRFREVPDGKGGIDFLDEYDVEATLPKAQQNMEKLQQALAARMRDRENGVEEFTRDIERQVEAGPVDSRGKNIRVTEEAQDGRIVPVMEKIGEETKSVDDSIAELTDAIENQRKYIQKLQMKEKAYRDVTRNLRAGYAKWEKSRQRRANVAKAASDPDYARKILADLDARRELVANDDVMRVFMNPTKYMIRVEKSIAEATGTGVKDGYVTRVIKDVSGGPRDNRPEMFAEMVLGRKLTPDELERVNTWHHAQKQVRSERGRRPKTSLYDRGTALRSPAQMREGDIPGTIPKWTKFNTGYTFEFAQDLVTPRVILKAYNEAQAFRVKMRVLQRVREVGIPVATLDEARRLENTGQFFVVGPAGSTAELKGAAKLADTARRIQDRLDNDLKLIVGDNPILENVSAELQRIGDLMMGEAGMVAIPKSYFEALTKEMRAADNALQKIIAAPTALFRAATLNLRPAWMVNNFVGQMLLLLVSQGGWHGLREYFAEVKRTLDPQAARATVLGKVADVPAATAAHGAVDVPVAATPVTTTPVNETPHAWPDAPKFLVPESDVMRGVGQSVDRLPAGSARSDNPRILQDPEGSYYIPTGDTTPEGNAVARIMNSIDRSKYDRATRMFQGGLDPYTTGYLFGSGRFEVGAPRMPRRDAYKPQLAYRGYTRVLDRVEMLREALKGDLEDLRSGLPAMQRAWEEAGDQYDLRFELADSGVPGWEWYHGQSSPAVYAAKAEREVQQYLDKLDNMETHSAGGFKDPESALAALEVVSDTITGGPRFSSSYQYAMDIVRSELDPLARRVHGFANHSGRGAQAVEIPFYLRGPQARNGKNSVDPELKHLLGVKQAQSAAPVIGEWRRMPDYYRGNAADFAKSLGIERADGEQLMFRGMAAEQMQSILAERAIRSHGRDNVVAGTENANVNFFADHPSPAIEFATHGGHTPFAVPEFGKSNYIIIVKADREILKRDKFGNSDSFFAIDGDVPIENIVGVVELRPIKQSGEGVVRMLSNGEAHLGKLDLTWAMRGVDLGDDFKLIRDTVAKHTGGADAAAGAAMSFDNFSTVRMVRREEGARVPSIKEQLNRRAGALTMGSGAMRHELAQSTRIAEDAYKWADRTPNVLANREYKAQRRAGVPKEEAWLKARQVTPGAPNTLAGNTLRLYLKRGTIGVTEVMGKINAILTDDMPRRAAFMAEVRPMLAAARRRAEKRGITDLTDEQLMEMVLSDDKATARLVDATMNDLIDFGRMSQAERDYIRPLLPFWSWMKGITLRTGRMVRDQPIAANAMYGLGAQYVAGAEERYGGAVPDYLKGALVYGKDDEGKPLMRPVHGMNIFQTPADIADMVAQATVRKGDWQLGGLNPLSQLNPVFKAPLEVMMGKDAFFGGPLYGRPEKGMLNPGYLDNPWTPEDESRMRGKAAASRYLNSLGPIQLYNQFAQAQGSGYQTLLERSPGQKLSTYLGLPSASVNMEVAAERAGDQEQYGMVRYDPTKGEFPGVFGRERAASASTKPSLF